MHLIIVTQKWPEFLSDLFSLLPPLPGVKKFRTPAEYLKKNIQNKKQNIFKKNNPNKTSEKCFISHSNLFRHWSCLTLFALGGGGQNGPPEGC